MKKKAIIISLCSVVFVAWIFGVVYTNVRAQRPVVKTYSMNEAVPYESDYFRRSDNILKGYTVTVLSSEILPYDEYAEKYNIDLPETGTDEFGNPIYRPVCIARLLRTKHTKHNRAVRCAFVRLRSLRKKM